MALAKKHLDRVMPVSQWVLWERDCSRLERRGVTVRPCRLHREQARSHRGKVSALD